MMRLSTKGRYASRLMFDVALHGQDGPVLLKDVARRQGISQKYLAHLVAPLKGAGLLHSSRGAHGGYVLSRPPQDITLAEVIRAVEGNLDFVECVGAPGICDRVDSCVTRDIWKRMSEKMMEMLSGITLQDLLNRGREKREPHGFAYSI